MKKKLKSFLKRYGMILLGLVTLVFTVTQLFNKGVFDSIYYVRRSPVVETRTFKEDSNIRPIFVTWTPNAKERDNRISPFLKDIDESPQRAEKIAQGGRVISKSVVTLTYGVKGISTGIVTGVGEKGYLYLYDKKFDTYKDFKVAYSDFSSNREELNKKLKDKYGSSYKSLPLKYKVNRSIKVNRLKNGKVEVYLKEHYSVKNQEEVDKVYKNIPKKE